MWDWKTWDQITWVENAGPQNVGPANRRWKMRDHLTGENCGTDKVWKA